VHRECTLSWLSENLRPNCFILSDCEGCEDVLFRPDAVANLRTCDLLIELHEQQVPNIAERLTSRFEPTHSYTLISQQEKLATDFRNLACLSEDERRLALDELRSERQRWLFLEGIERA